jgi:hypothetical protein
MDRRCSAFERCSGNSYQATSVISGPNLANLMMILQGACRGRTAFNLIILLP